MAIEAHGAIVGGGALVNFRVDAIRTCNLACDRRRILHRLLALGLVAAPPKQCRDDVPLHGPHRIIVRLVLFVACNLTVYVLDVIVLGRLEDGLLDSP